MEILILIVLILIARQLPKDQHKYTDKGLLKLREEVMEREWEANDRIYLSKIKAYRKKQKLYREYMTKGGSKYGR